MKNYNEMLAKYFYQDLRDWERTINDSLFGINFDSLTTEQYTLIMKAMALVNSIIKNVIEQQKK